MVPDNMYVLPWIVLVFIKTDRFDSYSRLFGPKSWIPIDNWYVSRISKVLICKINTPLHVGLSNFDREACWTFFINLVVFNLEAGFLII